MIITYDYNDGVTPAPYSSTIIDCDIDGTAISDGLNISEASAVRGLASMQRNSIYGMGSGIAVFSYALVADCLIENNYVHDLRAYGDPKTTGSHNESATIRGYVGNSLIFQNNSFTCKTGNDSGALFIQAYANYINNVSVTGNFLDSFGWDLGLEANNNGYGSQMRAVNNRFVDEGSEGLGTAYVTGGSGWSEWSENYVDDPTDPDHKGASVSQP